MKILVLGANGRVGRLVVKEATGRGHDVCAFVKSQTDLRFEQNSKISVITGDARSYKDVVSALTGCDAVTYCIANSLTSRVDRLYSSTTKVLIKAMKASSVTRLVWLTGYTGVKKTDTPLYQRIAFALPPFRQIYSDKCIAEQQLADSGLDYTKVECLLMNDRITKAYLSANTLKYNWYQLLTTSRLDAAKALVDQAELQNGADRLVVWSSNKKI